MLDTLRFVQGAVAKKDFVPALTHFRIENGLIRGYNGMLGLCCPIDLDLNISPNAVQLVKAIQTCKDTIQLHMTPSGRLSVKSGKFKVLVDCIQEEFPDMMPDGEMIELNGDLLTSMKILAPFIADDASRPWARGILFRGESAFVTNNVNLLEYWLGYTFPKDLNIPRAAILELLRIGEEPERLQVTETSVTFHFSDNRWLRTQLYSTQWPDVSSILGRESNPMPVPAELWEALEDVKPFVDDIERLFFVEDGIATSTDSAEGASVEVPGIIAGGCFNLSQLLLLQKVATAIDFSQYPKPCPFIGNRLRGAIVGIRL